MINRMQTEIYIIVQQFVLPGYPNSKTLGVKKILHAFGGGGAL
jgi:hypothetical protein